MPDIAKITTKIKEESFRLGFSHCGISKAGFLEEEAVHLEKWLKQGMHGKMSYMENYFDKRLDPTKLVEGSKSVISLLLNYFPSKKQTDPDAPKISRYAYGDDYHIIIKKKLQDLLSFIRETIGDVNGRAFVDSAPVLDRAWAQKSGLGWIGKNANLINPKAGSFFFIAELITDLELVADPPINEYCGTCTRCIDACPTEAIIQPKIVDGSKCISYFTIELKENIPVSMKGKFENWAFGCDICQEVCPWNRFASSADQTTFTPWNEMLEMNKKEWLEITDEVFEKMFKHSPLKRAGFKGLKRNLNFLYSSGKDFK
jgi:epoxyqueuosine reductase